MMMPRRTPPAHHRPPPLDAAADDDAAYDDDWNHVICLPQPRVIDELIGMEIVVCYPLLATNRSGTHVGDWGWFVGEVKEVKVLRRSNKFSVVHFDHEVYPERLSLDMALYGAHVEMGWFVIE